MRAVAMWNVLNDIDVAAAASGSAADEAVTTPRLPAGWGSTEAVGLWVVKIKRNGQACPLSQVCGPGFSGKLATEGEFHRNWLTVGGGTL